MSDPVLFLEPHFTHNIWGGTLLRDNYGYNIEGDDIGECWGIAAHPQGSSTVKNGTYAGLRLDAVYAAHPELFGNPGTDRFPLLTKIINARDDLSIQVHPDNEYARLHENGSYGKSECWYILEADPGSTLVIGHNAESREELREMILNGRFRELIREVPVSPGDLIQIDPGTVHAIKGGITLLETQQNSDITYRLYDYDRLWHGKKRELHIDKSIDVITVPAVPTEKCIRTSSEINKNACTNQLTEIFSGEYYRIFRMETAGRAAFPQSFRFLGVSVLSGAGSINGTPIKKGDHMILTADCAEVVLDGNLILIASTVR